MWGKSSVDISELRMKLQQLILKAEEKGVTLEECFKHFDKNGDGILNKAEFLQGLEKLGFKNNKSELNALFKALNADKDSSISYHEFVKFIKYHHLDDIKAKLQKLILEAEKKGVNIAQSFQHFDKDGNGILTRSEFEIRFNQLFQNINKNELNVIFKELDTNNSNSISYKEFFKFIQNGKPITTRQASINIQDLKIKLQKLILEAEKKGVNIARSFQHFDKDGNGILTHSEFSKGLRQLGFRYNKIEIKQLFEHLNVNNANTISYHEFIKFVKGPIRRRHVISISQEESLRQIKMKLKQLILRAESSGVNLQDSFKHFSPNDNGDITKANFKVGMLKLFSTIEGNELDTLYDAIDTDHSNSISYNEFLLFIRQEENADICNNPNLALKLKLRQLIINAETFQDIDIIDKFHEYIEDDSDSITRHNFQLWLKEIGIYLTVRELILLMSAIDIHHNDSITFQTFRLYLNNKSKHYEFNPTCDNDLIDIDMNDPKKKMNPKLIIEKLLKKLDTKDRLLDQANERLIKMENEKAKYEVLNNNQIDKIVREAVRNERLKMETQFVDIIQKRIKKEFPIHDENDIDNDIYDIIEEDNNRVVITHNTYEKAHIALEAELEETISKLKSQLLQKEEDLIAEKKRTRKQTARADRYLRSLRMKLKSNTSNISNNNTIRTTTTVATTKETTIGGIASLLRRLLIQAESKNMNLITIFKHYSNQGECIIHLNHFNECLETYLDDKNLFFTPGDIQRMIDVFQVLNILKNKGELIKLNYENEIFINFIQFVNCCYQYNEIDINNLLLQHKDVIGIQISNTKFHILLCKLRRILYVGNNMIQSQKKLGLLGFFHEYIILNESYITLDEFNDCLSSIIGMIHLTTTTEIEDKEKAMLSIDFTEYEMETALKYFESQGWLHEYNGVNTTTQQSRPLSIWISHGRILYKEFCIAVERFGDNDITNCSNDINIVDKEFEEEESLIVNKTKKKHIKNLKNKIPVTMICDRFDLEFNSNHWGALKTINSRFERLRFTLLNQYEHIGELITSQTRNSMAFISGDIYEDTIAIVQLRMDRKRGAGLDNQGLRGKGCWSLCVTSKEQQNRPGKGAVYYVEDGIIGINDREKKLKKITGINSTKYTSIQNSKEITTKMINYKPIVNREEIKHVFESYHKKNGVIYSVNEVVRLIIHIYMRFIYTKYVPNINYSTDTMNIKDHREFLFEIVQNAFDYKIDDLQIDTEKFIILCEKVENILLQKYKHILDKVMNVSEYKKILSSLFISSCKNSGNDEHNNRLLDRGDLVNIVMKLFDIFKPCTTTNINNQNDLNKEKNIAPSFHAEWNNHILNFIQMALEKIELAKLKECSYSKDADELSPLLTYDEYLLCIKDITYLVKSHFHLSELNFVTKTTETSEEIRIKQIKQEKNIQQGTMTDIPITTNNYTKTGKPIKVGDIISAIVIKDEVRFYVNNIYQASMNPCCTRPWRFAWCSSHSSSATILTPSISSESYCDGIWDRIDAKSVKGIASARSKPNGKFVLWVPKSMTNDPETK